MTLIDPFQLDPTPDSQDLSRIADLLSKIPRLSTYERGLIFRAWDTAREAGPDDQSRRSAWKFAEIIAVLPDESYLSPLLFWEAITQAAKPGLRVTPPTAYEIIRGLEWAVQHQSS